MAKVWAVLTCEQRLLGDHCVSVCNLLALFRNWRLTSRLWCSARTLQRDGRGIRERRRRESSRQPSGPSWTSWRWSNTDTLYVILQIRNRIGSQTWRLWEKWISLKGKSQYVQWNMNVLSIIILVSIEKWLCSKTACVIRYARWKEHTCMASSERNLEVLLLSAQKAHKTLLLKGKLFKRKLFPFPGEKVQFSAQNGNRLEKRRFFCCSSEGIKECLQTYSADAFSLHNNCKGKTQSGRWNDPLPLSSRD